MLHSYNTKSDLNSTINKENRNPQHSPQLKPNRLEALNTSVDLDQQKPFEHTFGVRALSPLKIAEKPLKIAEKPLKIAEKPLKIAEIETEPHKCISKKPIAEIQVVDWERT